MKPSNLAGARRADNDAELFWILKHGIKMTRLSKKPVIRHKIRFRQWHQLGVTIDPATVLRPPCAACHSAAVSSGVIFPIPKQRMLRSTF